MFANRGDGANARSFLPSAPSEAYPWRWSIPRKARVTPPAVSALMPGMGLKNLPIDGRRHVFVAVGTRLVQSSDFFSL
jgi:hypothetical protein